eukprot:SAG22_NODE_1240_length_5042_cov_103.645964_7_plen_163_part_00
MPMPQAGRTTSGSSAVELAAEHKSWAALAVLQRATPAAPGGQLAADWRRKLPAVGPANVRLQPLRVTRMPAQACTVNSAVPLSQTALHQVALLGDTRAAGYIIAALGGSGQPAAAAAVAAVDSCGRCAAHAHIRHPARVGVPSDLKRHAHMCQATMGMQSDW